ncbi:DUF2487 family protein [Virgibacillus sp. W0181]|uniref:DUF2487 family protein n=1 Tax=Virgibacillus sp. W0181 TaxID=3391581 RepID=UPI003F469DE1
MKWSKDDLKKYVTAKEYVDTVLVPLSPFHYSDESHFDKSALQREALFIFSNEIEKELSGRILLSPDYNYIKSNSLQLETQRLNSWVEDARKQPFNHIFFITFDLNWKKYEQALEGHLLWLPGIQGDLHSKEMITVIRGQVEQLGELIRTYWQDK